MNADLDIFALGRHALAETRAAFAGRAFFTATRRLHGDGSFSGPRLAVCSLIEETDLAAVGGLRAAQQAGANTLMASLAGSAAAEAAHLGLRTLIRVPFAPDEPEAERGARLDRLCRLCDELPGVDGVVPSPTAEPDGLDTLAFFAACRRQCKDRHVVVDLDLLGHKLGQLCLSFGADEILGPIASERPLRLGAHASSTWVTREEAALLLRVSGFVPCERLPEGKVQEL